MPRPAADLQQNAALGAEKGAFPNWERSIYAPDGPRYRNATRTCIAPTGTIAINVSSPVGAAEASRRAGACR